MSVFAFAPLLRIRTDIPARNNQRVYLYRPTMTAVTFSRNRCIQRSRCSILRLIFFPIVVTSFYDLIRRVLAHSYQQIFMQIHISYKIHSESYHDLEHLKLSCVQFTLYLKKIIITLTQTNLNKNYKNRIKKMINL